MNHPSRKTLSAFVSGVLASVALLALAHAGQTVLYEKASAYNTIVVTEEDNGLRALRFGKKGVRQSVVKPGEPDHLELPYAQAALVGLALSAEHRRLLVVGLGGGTLPMFLRKHYPNAIIDAVDIDPEVVDVAKAFFGFREDGLMRARIDDGRRFIENQRQPYDVIFLDAFGSDSVPEHLTTQEFLQAVRRAVAANGVVVSNLWGPGANPLYDAMVQTYQEVFDGLYILEVRDSVNRILLALPRGPVLTKRDLVHLARNVSVRKGLPFDLGNPVKYGFLDPPAKSLEARVLRDPKPEQRNERNP